MGPSWWLWERMFLLGNCRLSIISGCSFRSAPGANEERKVEAIPILVRAASKECHCEHGGEAEDTRQRLDHARTPTKKWLEIYNPRFMDTLRIMC